MKKRKQLYPSANVNTDIISTKVAFVSNTIYSQRAYSSADMKYKNNEQEQIMKQERKNNKKRTEYALIKTIF